MTGSLKTWFVRDLTAQLEREQGSTAIHRLKARLPERFHGYLSLGDMGTTLGGVPLDDAEELLLSFESVLGDGSGRLLEHLAQELFLRSLSQAGGVVLQGDLMGTVTRLRFALEQPYYDVPVTFELAATDLGFDVSLSVSGRPRSTRILRHVVAGAVRAAQTFVRDGDSALRIFASSEANRSVLSVQIRSPLSFRPPPVQPDSLKRRVSGSFKMPGQTLTEEVERIISRTRSSSPPPPLDGRPRSPSVPPPRSATPPPRGFTPPPRSYRLPSRPLAEPPSRPGSDTEDAFPSIPRPPRLPGSKP